MLADAGVPLSRVRELLAAGEHEFAAAVEDIDRRLRAEIRERQQPPGADRAARGRRQPGAPARGGRLPGPDPRGRCPEVWSRSSATAWILIVAQMPDEVPFLHGDQGRPDRPRRRARALPRPRGPGPDGPPTTPDWRGSRTAWPRSSTRRRSRGGRGRAFRQRRPGAPCWTPSSSRPSRARRGCSRSSRSAAARWTDIRRIHPKGDRD